MSVDLAIVGAGPAGMAAAVEAAEHGLSVTVLDDQPEPGGQIYRGIERAGPELVAILGEEYEAGRELAADFRSARIDYRPNSAVWRLDAGARIACSREGSASTISARRVLIATGAMERPVPIPGAERPGVMGAGAAQVLLKASGLVPAGRIVLAGSGPLLLLVGCQLLDAGAEVAAVLETTDGADYLDAAPALPRAMARWRDLARGVAMKRRLRRAGVAFRSGVRGLAATGESVRFDGGEIGCELLLLHEGVVPQTHLSRQAGLAHRWRPEQRHWAPVADALGRTAEETLLVAGDAGGIAGARAAALSGRVAARLAAGVDPGGLVAALDRERAMRPLLDRLFRPHTALPVDEALVCRCESVMAGDIRQAVRDGAMGPNQLKAFARVGMGPCQGRMCGLAAAEVIASERGLPVEEVGSFRIRPPIKPVTLGELASMEGEAAEAEAL